MTTDGTREFAERSTSVLERFGIYPVEEDRFPETIESRVATLRRARRRRGEGEKVGYMTLMDTDGVLRWELGLGPAPARRRRPQRGRAGTATTGDVVKQFKFEDLPPNEIGARLRQLDDWLTPNQGLREVTRKLTIGRKSRRSRPGASCSSCTARSATASTCCGRSRRPMKAGG